MSEEVKFNGLKARLAERGMSLRELADVSGVGYSTLQQLVYGMNLTGSDRVARLCAVLECSASDVMEFKGVEVSEKYEEGWRKYYPAVYGGVRYEPLRYLFRKNYGDEWKKKLSVMYEKAEVPKGMRARIGADEGIPLKYVGNICRVLRCTPGYVMEYK